MKENIFQNFCFQELQPVQYGTGMDYACSSWKLLPVKVGLSPFFVDGFVSHFAPLQLYSHYHTCDIFIEPDREIWDFSEGDWGLK